MAASAFHSVCFSKEDLYTWGLNKGQLGYSSGDDGPIQRIPKKVATLQAPIKMVTAIDIATICLLKNETVIVFANGGYSRVTYRPSNFVLTIGSNSTVSQITLAAYHSHPSSVLVKCMTQILQKSLLEELPSVLYPQWVTSSLSLLPTRQQTSNRSNIIKVSKQRKSGPFDAGIWPYGMSLLDKMAL